jgi:uncharacterized protein YebE (UPF0316 family)
MNLAIDWEALSPGAIPLILFGLRSLDLTLATVRMLSLIRGRAKLAWVLGVIESCLFVLGAAGLLSNLSDFRNVLAYAAGFATGIVIGLTLEQGLMPGHSLLRIYSAARGSAIVDALRGVGRGATEVPSRGLTGMVDLILCYVPRRQSGKVRRQVIAIDPDAVITAESVRALVGGWGT